MFVVAMVVASFPLVPDPEKSKFPDPEWSFKPKSGFIRIFMVKFIHFDCMFLPRSRFKLLIVGGVVVESFPLIAEPEKSSPELSSKPKQDFL